MAVRIPVRKERGVASTPAEDRRVPTNLTLPQSLVAELDEVAGKRNRSAFVEEAIRYRLKREKLRQAFEAVRGTWKGQGPAEWDEPDGVANWVRMLRAQETDSGPER